MIACLDEGWEEDPKGRGWRAEYVRQALRCCVHCRRPSKYVFRSEPCVLFSPLEGVPERLTEYAGWYLPVPVGG